MTSELQYYDISDYRYILLMHCVPTEDNTVYTIQSSTYLSIPLTDRVHDVVLLDSTILQVYTPSSFSVAVSMWISHLEPEGKTSLLNKKKKKNPLLTVVIQKFPFFSSFFLKISLLLK